MTLSRSSRSSPAPHHARRRLLAWSLLVFLAPLVQAQSSIPPKGPPGWERDHGWIDGGVSNPSATTVLLVHGLASNAAIFAAPHTAWNVRPLYYDPKTAPVLPQNVDAGISPRPARHNFFEVLGRSYKVAAWTQTPCIGNGGMPSSDCLSKDTFDSAYLSAPWALRKLLDETSGPVAIVAHSRGGLIARRLLKEFGNAGGRIKWLVTLHTPHSGTALAGRPAEFKDGFTSLLKDLPQSLSGPAISASDTLVAMTGARGAEELAPHGSRSLYPALRTGERQVPGIAYRSYGGTSPIAIRLYMKAPGLGVKVYSLFTSKAFAELTDGLGDMLVTDASARMPWQGAAHVSQPVHHAEVFWHLPTMMSVSEFLKTAPLAASGGGTAGS